MNGVHDLGGMHGFGPTAAEPQDAEPVFHADWEKSVLAMFNLLLPLRRFSLDRFRRMIETQAPVDYLRHSYYENWYASLSRLAVDSGLVTATELASAIAAHAAPRADGVARSSGDTAPVEAAATASMADGDSTGEWWPTFDIVTPPRFAPGDRVRAVNRHPEAHTREPRYVRGRVGVVEHVAGAEPLPELASENVNAPEPVYRVRFEASELWGATSTSRDAVYLELWETYLEPAA